MQVINAVAKFEYDLLIERTNTGIKRAKAKGRKFGRPSALTDTQKGDVLRLVAEGAPVAQIAFDTTWLVVGGFISLSRNTKLPAASATVPAPTGSLAYSARAMLPEYASRNPPPF